MSFNDQFRDRLRRGDFYLQPNRPPIFPNYNTSGSSYSYYPSLPSYHYTPGLYSFSRFNSYFRANSPGHSRNISPSSSVLNTNIRTDCFLHIQETFERMSGRTRSRGISYNIGSKHFDYHLFVLTLGRQTSPTHSHSRNCDHDQGWVPVNRDRRDGI